MLSIDRWLQNWRIDKARRWIPRGARVLDVGCHQGELFERLGDTLGPSLGIDGLAEPGERGPHRLLQDHFTERLPADDASFDAVVLLAVIEHIPNRQQLAAECARVLRDGGRVILTAPAPIVDTILKWLMRLRLADGMSAEEHAGFQPGLIRALFEQPGLRLEHHSRFQLRCNHLIVFHKPPTAQADA